MTNNSRAITICALVVILGLSLATLIITGTTSRMLVSLGETQTAMIANATKPETPIYFLDLGLGGGRCIRVFFDNNSNPVGGYTGTWNGSYDCAELAQTLTSHLLLSNTAASTSATTMDPAGYFANTGTILVLQSKLASSGVLATESVDGTYSRKTFDAIKAFQTKNKIPATGYMDPVTLRALDAVVITGMKPSGATKTIYEIKKDTPATAASAANPVKR